MSVIRNLFMDKLAIDLGTVNTRIYAPGAGIVLDEPSAIAVDKYTGAVVSVGAEAYRMLGREPRDTAVHCPISGGQVGEPEVTRKMLAALIGRARGGRAGRRHLVLGLPCSSTMIEQRSLRDAAQDVKATRLDLVDEGLAAALGAGADIGRAHLVVDVGGGTTNVAIVCSGKVISSTSLPAAGGAMSEAIRDYVRGEYAMRLGEQTVEEVKRGLGAARLVDTHGPAEERRMEVVGKDLPSGLAKSVELGSVEVREAIEPVLSELIAGVRRAVEEAQPEVTADLHHTGVILAGGGALLRGLVERLRSELRLHVALADEPQTAVARGLGRLLANPEGLRRGAIRQDVPAWQASEDLVVDW